MRLKIGLNGNYNLFEHGRLILRLKINELALKNFNDTKELALPEHWKILETAFYQRNDVVKIARELLGKIILTRFDNQFTAARIVETEAYNGHVDKASHAFGGRRTRRTEIMYAGGGVAYVYLCYGIHHLFNVVTNVENIPHAILVRAAEPVMGIEYMLERTGKLKADHSITKGPGNVSKALGLNTIHTGNNLMENEVLIVEDDYKILETDIIVTPRIGVGYADEDAKLMYRFLIKGNPYVSKGKMVKNEEK